MKKNDARSERSLLVCPCCHHGALSYDVTSGLCWTCRFPRMAADARLMTGPRLSVQPL